MHNLLVLFVVFVIPNIVISFVPQLLFQSKSELTIFHRKLDSLEWNCEIKTRWRTSVTVAQAVEYEKLNEK